MEIENRPQAQKSIRVRRLIMIETGSYNDMYERPYTTHINQGAIDSIMSRVSSTSSGNITPNLMKGISRGSDNGENIITPSPTPGGRVYIPEGWDRRRIRFTMEVAVISPTSGTTIMYMQGYTNYNGATAAGAIDPEMIMVVNSFSEVIERTYQDANGRVRPETVVLGSTQVISGHADPVDHYRDTYSMRPQDVFTGIDGAYLKSAHSSYSDSGATDLRNVLNGRAAANNRGNNVSTRFMSEIVNKCLIGLEDDELGQSRTDIYARSAGLLYDGSKTDNPFIRAIEKQQYSRGVSCGTSFRVADLLSVDPNLPHVTNFINIANPIRTSVGDSEYWDSTTRETLIATTLSHSVPALMLELSMSKIIFKSTNMDSGGMVTTNIDNALSLSSNDMRSNFDKFKARFATDIMYDLTYCNSDTYQLDMLCDIYGDSYITISINGAPPVQYTVPSFCDGLIAPVVTTDKSQYDLMCGDFDMLFNSLSPGYTGLAYGEEYAEHSGSQYEATSWDQQLYADDTVGIHGGGISDSRNTSAGRFNINNSI